MDLFSRSRSAFAVSTKDLELKTTLELPAQLLSSTHHLPAKSPTITNGTKATTNRSRTIHNSARIRRQTLTTPSSDIGIHQRTNLSRTHWNSKAPDATRPPLYFHHPPTTCSLQNLEPLLSKSPVLTRAQIRPTKKIIALLHLLGRWASWIA